MSPADLPVSRLWKQFLFVQHLALAFVVALCPSPFGQTQRERFWLAGRYDGNRVLVYFQAVKFRHTGPINARHLPDPVVHGFFGQVELTASYIAQFQMGPEAEHFAIGDQYDLLLENGGTVPVTLSTLVGSEGDEDVGNDSYIGALATVSHPDYLLFTRGYYVLRHHQEQRDDAAKRDTNVPPVGLVDEPIRSDIQNRMASLLNEQMKIAADNDNRREAERVPPALAVQTFRVADGSLRYYVRAQWKPANQADNESPYMLAAWMTPKPTLHILSLETRTSSYGFDSGLPKLLNVIDLGGGRTAIIVSSAGDDSMSLDLLEYRDGLSLRHMASLNSVNCGE